VSKRWTKEEEEFLKKNFNKMNNKELAEKFGVSTIAIQRKLSRLNLIRQVQKKWTKKEEEYLKEHYLEMTDAELAKKFGVTPIAVKRKLNRLGLTRKNKKKSKKVETKKAETVKDEKKQKQTETKKTTQPKYVKYSLTKTYNIGDVIYHEVYKDYGKIIDKQTSDELGYKLIVVDFEKNGTIILVEGIH
jgi:Zn-dependent peptidase ImmA (M78 family)